MKKSKIICLGSESYKDWLGESLIEEIEGSSKGLIIFTGGPDVPPMLYGEGNKYSHLDRSRSKIDVDNFAIALANGTPMLGICYGSQFLTAMQEGGKVIQDVSNHAIGRTHEIIDIHGNTLEITSTHHQMMYPFGIKNYELIAHSKERLSDRYLTGFGEYKNEDVSVEPEIVYYPDTNCLAIQGHPEFERCPEITRKYCRELVKIYLLKNK